MDPLTTTGPAPFRWCGPAHGLPSFPSLFCLWRSSAFAAPWQGAVLVFNVNEFATQQESSQPVLAFFLFFSFFPLAPPQPPHVFPAQEKGGLLEHRAAVCTTTCGTTLLKALAAKLKASPQAHEHGLSRYWEQIHCWFYLVLHLHKQLLLQNVIFQFCLGMTQSTFTCCVNLCTFRKASLSPFVSGRGRVSLVQCQIYTEFEISSYTRCSVL